MKLDAEVLKKHRFWILLGVAVPLILIAWLVLSTGVSSEIAKAKGEVDQKLKTLKSMTDVKSNRWLKFGKLLARNHKDLEERVWAEAYFAQAPNFTWPTEFENTYHFKDGLFALKIAATRQKQGAASAPGTPPPAVGQETAKEPVEEKVIETVSGTITAIDNETLTMKTKDKGDLLIRRTPKVQVTITGEGMGDQIPTFNALHQGDQVEVTYQRGKYFGDELTPEELIQFVNFYPRQIPPIIDLVQPLREDGSGLVQFRGWMPGSRNQSKENMPPPGAPFFHYVAEWKTKDNKQLSEEAWTAQEDLWVQRELFRMIRNANDYVAEFRCEGGIGNDWFYFTGDEWNLKIKLTKENKLKIELINVSPFSQKTVGNVVFLVRVNDDADAKKNFATINIKNNGKVKPLGTFTSQTDFDMPPGVTPKGIFGVFQRVNNEKYNEYMPEGGGKGNSYFFSNPYWRFKLSLDEQNQLKTEIINRGSIPQRMDIEFRVKINNEADLPEKERYGAFRVQHGMIDPKSAPIKKGPYTLRVVPGAKIAGIYGMRQVLTWEFAAVKRIDQISIGSGVAPGSAGAADGLGGGGAMPPGGGPAMPPGGAPSGGAPLGGDLEGSAGGKGGTGHSHRTFPKGLKNFPAFKVEEKEAANTGQDVGGAPGGGAPGPSGMPGAGGMPAGTGGMPEGGGLDGGAPKVATTPNGFALKRYEEVTGQARKLPVSVALIVDQDQVGRVLAAFTNSKLRFLTTQVLMNRYPHSVRPMSGSKKSSSEPSLPPGAGGFFPPGGMGPPGLGGFGPPGSGAGMPPGGLPGMPYGGGSFGGAPSAGGVSGGDDRITNVELVIYGFVTLYQRYPPRPEGSTPPQQ